MTLALLLGAASAMAPNANGTGGPDDGAAPIAQPLGDTTGTTQADPSSILQSVTNNGGNIVAVLKNPATMTDTPDECVRWSIATRDAFGSLHDVYPEDAVLLRLWTGDNGLPADVIVGAALTAGPMTATSQGVGVTLHPSATGLVVGQPVNGGSSWTTTAASAAFVSTVGAELQLGVISSTVGRQTRYQVHPIDAVGGLVTTLNTSPAANGNNSATGPFNTLTVWAGWRTGSGGVAGSTVSLHADLVVIPAARVGAAGRAALQDANALPFSGAPPSQVTILALGNSHIQGAASGATDPTWGNVAVQAGVTFRWANDATTATNVTTYGPRPGSIPYLAQLLLDAGVAEINVVLNAGSGRSAGGVLANLGYAAAHTYALGPGENHPDAIMYVQSAGNIATEQMAADFTRDFPLVLDMLDALYPGVPVFAGSGIDQDFAAVPYWQVVDLEKQRVCATISPITGRPRCTWVDIFLDPSDLDGTRHPTVGAGEGTDLIAQAFAAAWGVP